MKRPRSAAQYEADVCPHSETRMPLARNRFCPRRQRIHSRLRAYRFAEPPGRTNLKWTWSEGPTPLRRTVKERGKQTSHQDPTIMQPEPTPPVAGYAFGPFQLDAGKRVVWREGRIVPMTAKTFDVLLLLVEQRG